LAKISEERLTQLFNEIKMAKKINEDIVKPQIVEAIQRYTGRHIPEIGTDWTIVVNEIYPIIQYYLPAMFFRNPKAYLKPRNKTFIKTVTNPITGKKEEVQANSMKASQTKEYITNYILELINYKEEVRKVLLDALLAPYSVLWHGYKGDFGMTDENSFYIENENIFVKRTPPLRFLKDPSVAMSNYTEGKWVGRSMDVPYQDLIDDDELDVDKSLIKGFEGYGLKVGGRDSRLPEHNLLDVTDEEYRKSKSCRFVEVYEVFLKPTKKEKKKGISGWILLLTPEQKKPLRQSEWVIDARGFPGVVFELNQVPDQIIGMSDIESYKTIADQKNAIFNMQLRNAEQNSKVWVGLSKEGMDGEEDVDAIKQGDQTIVMFPDGNPSQRMFVASPGGQASSELYVIDQRIQKNLDEKSGVTELKKGFLQSGEESATSVAIRNAGSNARIMYRQDLMKDFLTKSVTYITQLEEQFFTIKDAVRIVGSLDVEWSEKPSKEEIQVDTDVEIDVLSMLPENPEREMQELQSVLSLMIQAITVPEIGQKLAQEGMTIELKPIIEQLLMRMKIRNPNVFRAIKPEESMGFASIQQLREAQQNVAAAISGQEPPAPPEPEDDHRTKLEVYGSIANLLQMMGQRSDILMQLIATQQALLEEKMRKEGSNVGQKVKLDKPSKRTFA